MKQAVVAGWCWWCLLPYTPLNTPRTFTSLTPVLTPPRYSSTPCHGHWAWPIFMCCRTHHLHTITPRPPAPCALRRPRPRSRPPASQRLSNGSLTSLPPQPFPASILDHVLGDSMGAGRAHSLQGTDAQAEQAEQAAQASRRSLPLGSVADAVWFDAAQFLTRCVHCHERLLCKPLCARSVGRGRVEGLKGEGRSVLRVEVAQPQRLARSQSQSACRAVLAAPLAVAHVAPCVFGSCFPPPAPLPCPGAAHYASRAVKP